MADQTDVLDDVLAYLAQRRDNAEAVAKAHAKGSDEWVLASDRRRQIEVIIDDLRAGMHHGAAAVREMLREAL